MGTRKLGPLVHSKSPEIEYKSLRPKCRKNLGSGSLSVGCTGGKGKEAGSGEQGAGAGEQIAHGAAAAESIAANRR